MVDMVNRVKNKRYIVAQFFFLLLLVTSFLFIPLSAVAIPFSTSYVSLEIPDGWSCVPDGVNWICFNKANKKLRKEAVIILTAKETGPQDNLAEYTQYLKRKKQYRTKKGKVQFSRVFHSKRRTIHKHPWIDGFHLSSEVSNYYTRYLATTKKSLAVLVTYTAHKNHWRKYASVFNRSIQSLRLHAVDEALLKKIRGLQGKSSGKSIRDYLEGIFGDDTEDEDSGDGEQGFFGKNAGAIGGSIATGIVFVILWKLLQKRRAKRRKKSTSGSKRRNR